MRRNGPYLQFLLGYTARAVPFFFKFCVARFQKVALFRCGSLKHISTGLALAGVVWRCWFSVIPVDLLRAEQQGRPPAEKAAKPIPPIIQWCSLPNTSNHPSCIGPLNFWIHCLAAKVLFRHTTCLSSSQWPLLPLLWIHPYGWTRW